MVDGRVVNYMRPTTTCRASQVWSTRSTVDELLIDLAWRNFPSPEYGTKFEMEVPLFLEIREFLYRTVEDGWKEASVPKTARSV